MKNIIIFLIQDSISKYNYIVLNTDYSILEIDLDNNDDLTHNKFTKSTGLRIISDNLIKIDSYSITNTNTSSVQEILLYNLSMHINDIKPLIENSEYFLLPIKISKIKELTDNKTLYSLAKLVFNYPNYIISDNLENP